MKKRATLESAVSEDSLIRGLLEAKGKRVEIVAFGIAYQGILQHVDADDGIVIISSGDDQAVLELERIESLCMLTEEE